MAITKSAKRAVRGSKRKKVGNDRRKKVLKETLKEVRALATSKDKKVALSALSKAYQAIDKAAKTNVIKKNTASRKKSRLAAVVRNIK